MPLSQFQPDHYKTLLQEKHQRVIRYFEGLDMPEPALFESAPMHYRMRAEFRIWHEQDDLFYAMFDPASPKEPIRIDDFPVACQAIAELMQPLRETLLDNDLLRKRLFQIEFLSTLRGETLVTLIYHRPLDESWAQEAEKLASRFTIQVIGRSRKQKLVLQHDYVLETLQADGRSLHYRQYEGGFTQPNAGVNEKMLGWACEQAQNCTGDLLELYCGNGNFTVPLSAHFPQVLATEISKTSVKAARENFQMNAVQNVAIARMSSEEISQALAGERKFRRLQDIPLEQYQLETVFVDPPRAGLDEFTCQLIARYPCILYISCNPETLARDLRVLSLTHRAERFALFDQFPYTEHMECGVLLRSRG